MIENMIENLNQTLSQVDIAPGTDPDQINIPMTDLSQGSLDTILEVVFATLGIVAFLVIVIAGMQFVLSRGEADKAAKARNTIIYAAVGLVLAVSAYTIVRFVTGSVA